MSSKHFLSEEDNDDVDLNIDMLSRRLVQLQIMLFGPSSFSSLSGAISLLLDEVRNTGRCVASRWVASLARSLSHSETFVCDFSVRSVLSLIIFVRLAFALFLGRRKVSQSSIVFLEEKVANFSP